MNYATWALFAADIAATLTGDLTGAQQTATTESASSSFATALAGHTLTLTSAVNPLGNFGAGYQSTRPAGAWYAFSFACSSASAGAKIILSKLNLKALGADSGNGYIRLANTSANIISTVRDCVLDCNGFQNYLIKPYHIANIANIFNCVFITTGGGVGFVPITVAASSILEHCTTYGSPHATYGGFCNYANAAVTVNDIGSFRTGGGKDFTYGSGGSGGLGNAVASKCASSDTTGSEAGLRSLVAADQFQSLTLADGDPFLRLKAGSALLGAGVAPSIAANTYGIRGNVRPHGGLYSIGADEWRLGGDYHRVMRGVGRGIMRGAR
jgi:hypothetical protein